MYDVFEQLMKERNLKIADVSRLTGIPYSTFSDWKAGRYTPKDDKRKKIAQFFGVSLEYLDTGKDAPVYYISDDAAQVAQWMVERPEGKILFQAARRCSPDSILLAAQLLEKLKETNPDG